MAELAACSLVVGSNPAWSNSDGLISITRIDGYIMSDKCLMEFLDTISGAHEMLCNKQVQIG